MSRQSYDLSTLVRTGASSFRRHSNSGVGSDICRRPGALWACSIAPETVAVHSGNCQQYLGITDSLAVTDYLPT